MANVSPVFGSLVPTPKKQALEGNYLNFTDGTSDFAQQYLPEIYEAEVERYGNRTLGGFLRMVGAEMPMTSDQVVWSEQNRLHVALNDCTASGGANVQQVKVDNIGTGAGDTCNDWCKQGNALKDINERNPTEYPTHVTPCSKFHP